jgi:hypothetical protein
MPDLYDIPWLRRTTPIRSRTGSSVTGIGSRCPPGYFLTLGSLPRFFEETHISWLINFTFTDAFFGVPS